LIKTFTVHLFWTLRTVHTATNTNEHYFLSVDKQGQITTTKHTLGSKPSHKEQFYLADDTPDSRQMTKWLVQSGKSAAKKDQIIMA